MIKCGNGFTEIKGEKVEIMAEACCILKSLKKTLGQEDYKKVIEISEMTDEEVKNKVQEQENELNRMANMFFKMLFSKDGE